MPVIAPFTDQELADLWEFDRRVERGAERYELNSREKPFFEDYPECRAAVDAAMKKGRIVYRPDALKQLHRMGLRNYDRIVEATGVSPECDMEIHHPQGGAGQKPDRKGPLPAAGANGDAL